MSETLRPLPLSASPASGRGGALRLAALAAAGAGGILCLAALATETGRARFGYGYLLGFGLFWCVVLGSLFFVALQHLTRSVWSVVLRRPAEALAAPAWLAALLFLPLLAWVLLRGEGAPFPWVKAAAVAADPLLQHKAPYLNPAFFTARAVVFFLLWGFSAAFFVGRSLRQDHGRAGPEATAALRRYAAPFMVLFGLTVTFASFDWLMSLAPRWFSTIFGVYVFAGMVLSGLAAITLFVLGLRNRGALSGVVRGDHLYSLGALLFAFTCFWAYIAFSQFMLIWYANLPEETEYLVHRTRHGWLAVSVLLAGLRFVAPFFLLLSREAKMNGRSLAAASVLVLAGQWVDLYWLILPEAPGGVPVFGFAEAGPTLLFAGLLVYAAARFLGRHGPVPAGDPWFERSRTFHL